MVHYCFDSHFSQFKNQVNFTNLMFHEKDYDHLLQLPKASISTTLLKDLKQQKYVKQPNI